jgi:cysteinyl-tRNA synthetase
LVLKLYNTRTRRKEEFTPLDPSNVRMYVCGPTVYDYAHIGNARPVIVFDVLFRLLRHLAAEGEWDGGKGQTEVTYVRNITDVDDKINARAAEQYPDMPLNKAIRKVTEETAAQFHRDVAALGCLEPTVEPRATEHIDDMKRMIETLVEKGCAYAAEGHVLFHVAAMKDYGQLSRRSLDEMQAGARVEVAPYKRDPMDFVLWKPSKEGEPGWPSPCGIEGLGRPGWHIECSAMSERHLGKVFDIHGGGIDLVFPHHENELAQSRCAHGTDLMAQVWMHNGFLQVEGEKMSKSLGNFVTIRDLLVGNKGLPWPGDAIRLAMIMTHYRQPTDWTTEKLATAGANLHTFNLVGSKGLGIDQYAEINKISDIKDSPPSDDLLACLLDDLNTPSAILGHLFSLVKSADQPGGIRKEPARQLIIDCQFLGIDPFRYVREEKLAFQAHKSIDEEKIDELIQTRIAARKAKNWAEADRIRDELVAMGIVLMDAKDPETGEIVTTWEIAR